MSVSNGWKSHFGESTKFGDITINTEAGVPKWSVKMVFLTVSQNSQETFYVGVSYLKSSRLLADLKETPTQVFSCEL